MSEYVPFEIQVEIIKRLPVKSLIQFRSVSKAWKSLIDSSKFIASHAVRRIQPQRLIVSNFAPVPIEEKYVSFVDDDTFPQQKFALTVPLSVKSLDNDTIIIGSSHGLLCLYGFYRDSESVMKSMFVLWNPSIRKSIDIVDDNVSHEDFLGFGVCPVTGDPKIVKIPFGNQLHRLREINKLCEVKIYTVSSGEWRSVYTNLPSQSIEVSQTEVVTDGHIHWLASDITSMDGKLRSYRVILSFDTTNENLRVIDLPDSLSRQLDKILTISKVGESLAVVEYGLWIIDDDIIDEEREFSVWIMEDGVSKSFTKFFTFKAPDAPSITVLGFRKSGEAVIETQDYDDEYASLVVVEPHSEHIHDLDFNGRSFDMHSYTETLLLLDQ